MVFIFLLSDLFPETLVNHVVLLSSIRTRRLYPDGAQWSYVFQEGSSVRQYQSFKIKNWYHLISHHQYQSTVDQTLLFFVCIWQCFILSSRQTERVHLPFQSTFLIHFVKYNPGWWRKLYSAMIFSNIIISLYHCVRVPVSHQTNPALVCWHDFSHR